MSEIVDDAIPAAPTLLVPLPSLGFWCQNLCGLGRGDNIKLSKLPLMHSRIQHHASPPAFYLLQEIKGESDPTEELQAYLSGYRALVASPGGWPN
ncbi:hypothetical protein GGF42_007923, partial [Coemansia sp. RSA 2424]